MAPVAPDPVEVWTENPNQRKFNPGTKHGEAIFKIKTKRLSEDKQLALWRENAQTFFWILETTESDFGTFLTRVPVDFDNAGAPTSFFIMV